MIDKNIIKIHVCGNKDFIYINGIFPEPCNQKKDGILIGDRQYKTEKYNWIAKIYDEKDFRAIFQNIQTDSDSKQNKISKHVILSFGDEDNENLFE